MPITLYDEDQNPHEVPTAEELAVLQENSAKVEALIKEKEELEQSVNPNFKLMRETNKKLTEALKNSGKEIDEEGNIIEKKAEINKEEILGDTKRMIEETTFANEKERLLSQYSEEDKQTINVYLEKLMSGEEKNISNLNKFLDQTINFVFPGQSNQNKRVAFSGNGSVPNFKNDNKVSEGAISIGNAMGHSAEDLENKADPVIKF